MRLIFGILFSILILFLSSCNQKPQFPEKKCEKFSPTAVTINKPLFQYEANTIDSSADRLISNELQQLKNLISRYENREQDFSVEKMEALWESEKNKIGLKNIETVSAWIEATGFLLEITGKPVYAEALQQLSITKKLELSSSDLNLAEKELAPFIFTRSVDHIFVNLFVDSSVEYEHSLRGKVKITLESNGSRGFLLKFNMEEKRYVEVNILIPTWTTNATVIEKNVKYVATAGEYCLVARKWNDGDFVEVTF